MSNTHAHVFIIFKAESGAYAWNLIDSDKKPIASSVDTLPNSDACRKQIEIVRGSSRAAIVEKPTAEAK